MKSREQEERANVPVYQIVDVIRILIKVVPIMCCVVGGGGDGRCTVGKHISLFKRKEAEAEGKELKSISFPIELLGRAIGWRCVQGVQIPYFCLGGPQRCGPFRVHEVARDAGRRLCVGEYNSGGEKDFQI